jgi:branched-chain amino acid transport system ATP-binding protein
VRAVSKRFGGTVAVDDVSFEVPPGGSLGLIGPNGAGKSTLLRLIAGAYRPDSGEILFGEHHLERTAPYAIPRLGVALAHQIPRPFSRLTVRQNVLVAARARRQRHTLRRHARQQTDVLLERAGLASRAHRMAGDLGLLDRKRLELARALALEPQLLMLDEVAAGLTGPELDEIVELINALRDGRSLIVVEHVETVVERVADQAIVLDWGKELARGTPAQVAADPKVIEVYFGTGAGRPDDPGRSSSHTKRAATKDEPLLRVERLSVDYGQLRALRAVDLEVRAGEIVAVLGANGAGKTTLARAVSGLSRAAEGRVMLRGRDITALPAHRRVALGIAHCQEGRKIFAALSVRENLELGAYASHARAGIDERLAMIHRVFPILAEYADRPGNTLSGGQQQMLAIGRALMSKPDLAVFDEISIGLAPEAIDRLYGAIPLINELGVAILLIEQNVYRSLQVADRAYILDRGSVSFAGDPSELHEEERLSLAYFGTPRGGERSRSLAHVTTPGGET